MTLVPHNRLTHGPEEAEAVARVAASGQWACGPRVAELEERLADMAGVGHAVCVASGLSALRLAMLAFEPAEGAHILVPAYSCVALANAALAIGAEPVAVDILARNLTIDPEAAPDGAMAVAVNTFGAPADTEALAERCEHVIEDCAHSFGASVSGRAFGSRASAAILSFYATKLIGAGEGGAVLTNDPGLAESVRERRDYTDKPPSALRLNDKMTDLEAALALCQLDRLPSMLALRAELAERYHHLLAATGLVGRAFTPPGDEPDRIWYRYALRLHGLDRKRIVRAMEKLGVLADAPVEDWRGGRGPSCPNADRAYTEILSLPLYPTLTHAEQDRVVPALAEACLSELKDTP